MDDKRATSSSALKGSAAAAFDMSSSHDPHFVSGNLDRSNKTTVDQEWKNEGWYFVPPEADSTRKPVFEEPLEPCWKSNGEIHENVTTNEGEHHEPKA